ncbi:DNA polymerase III subunit epsilon [Buchnera aphidicola (Pemphigus obesinymphae)]|uniref:DNA polymerase III subunit epsilon n=1 Tax=Buchnera aphidicola TaxID=9 RepID=UPI002237C427|nr:DNA polymerase III subunit epsilon [Buchnera aphidicola]MCW5196486.1 DNA polymerase III subunit epsilon [Buchnera aphidicola (Pemphigus obesinymphae)]
MKKNKIRQIALDTETTGINNKGIFYEKQRIIEIGAIEIIDRNFTGNNFHTYIQPNRSVDPKAFSVHGISDEFLKNKPIFNDIAVDFLNYINGAELIIHNADFDIGFINYELSMLNLHIKNILSCTTVVDTLLLSRKIFPGKKNTLDSLCSRYFIRNNERDLHSALLDAQLLAKVYLAMTSFQESIDFFDDTKEKDNCSVFTKEKNNFNFLKVRWASAGEKKLHKLYLEYMMEKNKKCLWYFNK